MRFNFNKNNYIKQLLQTDVYRRDVTEAHSHLPLGVQRLCGGGGWRVELQDAERLEAGRELDLAAVNRKRLVTFPHEAVAVRHDAHLMTKYTYIHDAHINRNSPVHIICM